MRYAAFLIFLLLSGSIPAQEAVKEDATDARKFVEPTFVYRPDRAVSTALRDAELLADADPKFALRTRWVMVNNPSEITRPGLAYACGTTLLHSAVPVRPIPAGTPGVWRIDLGEFVGHDLAKLKLMLDTWDRMTDPQFYLQTDELITVSSPWFSYSGDDPKYKGQRFNQVQVKKHVPAAHCNPDGKLDSLMHLTQSNTPIISIGQFMRFAINSDFGGLYPEFRGFEIAPTKGTAEEVFLARARVDLAAFGSNNTDQRVVCYGIPTGQPRLIEYMPAAITQSSVGPTIVTITRDYFAGPIDNSKHPIENLGERRHDGTEIFLPTPAGGLEFALFNGAGGFVRSAPLNPPQSLASDRTIPAPWPPVLQGPSSCIRCHWSTNPDTLVNAIYQPAPNYVTYLRNARIPTPDGVVQFDVFQEKGDSNARLKRLVALYHGETSEAFGYAGRTYAKFVFTTSGVTFEEAARAMMKIHDDWLYSFVTPKKACLLLGYKVDTEEQAVDLFNQICPLAPEPLRVTEIRTWHAEDRPYKIPIDDFLAIYPEVALRVQIWEKGGTRPRVPAAETPKEGETK